MNTPKEWHAISPDFLTGEPAIQIPTYGFQVARPILPEPDASFLFLVAVMFSLFYRFK